jgi:hypothetical protein
MKKTLILISLFVVFTLLAACSPTEEAVAVLTVGEQEYSQDDLEALGTLSVDYTDKDGQTTTYEGVLLSDVLSDAGVTGETVVFTATDGYEAEMPMADAMACANCIVAFDDGSLRMVMPEQSGKLQVKDVVEIIIY